MTLSDMVDLIWFTGIWANKLAVQTIQMSLNLTHLTRDKAAPPPPRPNEQARQMIWGPFCSAITPGQAVTTAPIAKPRPHKGWLQGRGWGHLCQLQQGHVLSPFLSAGLVRRRHNPWDRRKRGRHYIITYFVVHYCVLLHRILLDIIRHFYYYTLDCIFICYYIAFNELLCINTKTFSLLNHYYFIMTCY